MTDRPMREVGKRAAGPGRHVYAAGAVALTEPGPAAAGLGVADERGRLLPQRSHYLRQTSRARANVQALLAAPRAAAPLRCEGGDFTHRGIPCKHVLGTAREIGAIDQVFQVEPVSRRAS